MARFVPLDQRYAAMARAGAQVAAAGRMLAAFAPGLRRRAVKAAKRPPA